MGQIGPRIRHGSDSLTDSAAKPYVVGRLDAGTAAAWDEFVTGCAEATFFHRAGWKTVVERAFGHKTHYLYVQRGNAIVGVLPLVEVKSALFGHALISNGFSVCGGPAVAEEPARHLLTQTAEGLLKSTGASYLEFRCPAKLEAHWQTRENLYAGFSAALPVDEEENLKQIPRKQRAVVRKAMASQLTYTIDANTDRLYDLYAVSVRNLGTPVFSRAYFKALLDVFGPDCDVLTVQEGDKALSSVLNFYFRGSVMPFYTGALREARKLGAADLMYWRLMRHAAAKGCTVFDFGRSKVGTGPYDFKKNWGFTPAPLAHQYLMRPGVPLPNINPTNSKYKLMIEVWKRLPVPVANILGPPIVRNIA
jgi:FemAB-related protein (PEP-CTERM system-associated)